VEVDHIDSERLEAGAIPEAVREADGLLVPMGFGQRGTEGKSLLCGMHESGGCRFLVFVLACKWR